MCCFVGLCIVTVCVFGVRLAKHRPLAIFPCKDKLVTKQLIETDSLSAELFVLLVIFAIRSSDSLIKSFCRYLSLKTKSKC